MNRSEWLQSLDDTPPESRRLMRPPPAAPSPTASYLDPTPRSYVRPALRQDTPFARQKGPGKASKPRRRADPHYLSLTLSDELYEALQRVRKLYGLPHLTEAIRLCIFDGVTRFETFGKRPDPQHSIGSRPAPWVVDDDTAENAG